MQKPTESIFVPNSKQKVNSNKTTYNQQKNSTMTRSETSGKIESVQNIYRKTNKN